MKMLVSDSLQEVYNMIEATQVMEIIYFSW